MTNKGIYLGLAALLTSLLVHGASLADGFEIFPRPNNQYTVEKGDSLYSIARKLYLNPDLWRNLWRQNPGIAVNLRHNSPEKQELAPGTKMLIYDAKSSYPVFSEPYAPPTGIPDDVKFFSEKFVQRGIPYDKQYFRYKLSPVPNNLWGYIVSSPEVNKTNFLERDLVYIRFRPSKKQTILVGDRLGIYRDRGPLYHPVNPEREIGYLTDIVGELEVTSTGHDLITGIIIESYVEITRGDKVCLYTPRAREIVPSKTHKMMTATILVSATRDMYYTQNLNLETDIVFIDRGECDGMREGTLLNIYRPNEPHPDPYTQRWLSLPDTYLGEGIILKAFEQNSSVLITRSREEIMPGDIIKSVSD